MQDSSLQPTVPINELERLRTFVSEVITALRSQQEILRTRGMNLPPGVIQNLENVDRDLEGLGKQLSGEETELGQLRGLAANSAMINSSLDLDSVLNLAMDEVIGLSGAERGYIVLRDLETGELDFRVVRDLEAADRTNGTFQGSTTILGEALNSGQPMLTDNAYKDPRMQENMSIAQMALRSVLCVPLSYKGTVIGAIYVDNRLRVGVFTDRELHLLVAFANQVAVAIENARLFARVQSALAEITELKEVMANVFASIGSGVITTDTEDRIMTFNAAAAEILGQAEPAATGYLLTELLPKVNLGFDEYLRAVREHNQSQILEAELDAAELGRRALSFKLSPLKDAWQQTQGVAIVVDDLTEQREREEKLTILSRYLPPALVKNIVEISQLALGGERREMTCVFAEVRALSTLPANLRPQQVMEIINEYLSVATESIHLANGVIDKYMGTEIMALFNSQLNPMEDHGYRAVEAALAMRDAFAHFYARSSMDPGQHYYRVGVHTGVATLGNVGSLSRRNFTALGDTINLSHRLLENARPGQIIISEATCLHIEGIFGRYPDHIQFEERKPIRAKGRQQATPVYEVFRRHG